MNRLFAGFSFLFLGNEFKKAFFESRVYEFGIYFLDRYRKFLSIISSFFFNFFNFSFLFARNSFIFFILSILFTSLFSYIFFSYSISRFLMIMSKIGSFQIAKNFVRIDSLALDINSVSIKTFFCCIKYLSSLTLNASSFRFLSSANKKILCSSFGLNSSFTSLSRLEAFCLLLKILLYYYFINVYF